MKNKVYVLGYRDKCPEGYSLINTTSKSTNWSKGLSPFYVGSNIELYDGFVAKNIENAWQFSKLYPEYADDNGNPTNEYFEWAKKGWNDTFAHRYPMKKGSKPLYSIWSGKRFDYIPARKHIYIKLYAREVIKTAAFRELYNRYISGEKIALLDFDGYNYWDLGFSMDDVIHNPERKMGHAFVLAMLLEGIISVKNGEVIYHSTIGKIKKVKD